MTTPKSELPSPLAEAHGSAYDCEFCGENQGDIYGCGAIHPATKGLCTRTKGHAGEHVACGTTDHDLKRWPNDRISDPAKRRVD